MRQQLTSSRFSGKTKVVIKILVGLAQQLTSTGYLTPMDGPKPALQKITIADFMTRGGGDVEVSPICSSLRRTWTKSGSVVVEGRESDWYDIPRVDERLCSTEVSRLVSLRIFDILIIFPSLVKTSNWNYRSTMRIDYWLRSRSAR